MVVARSQPQGHQGGIWVSPPLENVDCLPSLGQSPPTRRRNTWDLLQKHQPVAWKSQPCALILLSSPQFRDFYFFHWKLGSNSIDLNSSLMFTCTQYPRNQIPPKDLFAKGKQREKERNHQSNLKWKPPTSLKWENEMKLVDVCSRTLKFAFGGSFRERPSSLPSTKLSLLIQYCRSIPSAFILFLAFEPFSTYFVRFPKSLSFIKKKKKPKFIKMSNSVVN